MYILDSGCGWIPDAPIKFMYHIINLIKNLTPVVLIIMGSLDFGKAVMSQKEDEIKKAQGAFIKKLIAGAAVFFVVVFAKWVVKILVNAGLSDGNQTLNCVNALLNDAYTADDKQYYDGPKTTTKENYEICKNKCANFKGTAQSECLKSCDNRYSTTTVNSNKLTCFEECRKAGQSKEYCNKHCGDTPAGTWEDCMNPCLNAGQSKEYCNKHCETYFNGGSNYNPTATTTKNNQKTKNTTTTTKQTNNNAWNICKADCMNTLNDEVACNKHCESNLYGGSN